MCPRLRPRSAPLVCPPPSCANHARGAPGDMHAAALAPLLLHALVPSPTRPLPQHSVPRITRPLPRRIPPVHRRRPAVMRAGAPGEDGGDDDALGEEGEEGWRPELELARYRLEGRAQSDSLSESEDLSDPDTWAVQTGLLKERSKQAE